MLRKANLDAGLEGGGPAAAASGEVAVNVPDLAEFLTATAWPEDGSPRATGTLLVCTGEGRYRACLNDRDQCRQQWVSAASLEELLVVADKVLRDGTGEWRRSQPPPTKRK